ncbi:MAG: tetratricopeptide repeat protein [Sulfurovum sp.]
MENILPAYNDPLFSILLIIVIALIISLVTYAWGLYKQQKEQGNLLKFLEKFDTAECQLDTTSMPFDAHMLKPMALLAQAFDNDGEYHKAISIYLYLIKNIQEEGSKLELTEKLGKTYFHAGFLERAQKIFEEILRKKPRNVRALYMLEVVFEKMQNYTKASEILEPLELLGEETQPLHTFLHFSQLIADKRLSKEEKVEQLLALLRNEPKLYREVISVLFHLDTQAAWQAIDRSRIKELIDILWFLPQSQLSLDIIAQNRQLKTLYYAKGYIQEPATESGIFTLDMLATAKQNGFKEGDLHFTYLCSKCKQSFPISFKRCPNCMALHTVEVEEHIAKSDPKTDYSLF